MTARFFTQRFAGALMVWSVQGLSHSARPNRYCNAIMRGRGDAAGGLPAHDHQHAERAFAHGRGSGGGILRIERRNEDAVNGGLPARLMDRFAR
jgi:hypothetical protein